MKILHVITGMQKAAGTTTFVENVVNGLRNQGHDVEIVMSPDGFCQCDIIHIHGLWSGLLHKASRFAKTKGIPVVWSTHGMTAPWSMRHKWWKKLPAWLLYQKRDLMHAAAIHCTTEQEVEWNKSLGFKNCFVAPLGTHLPKIDQFHSRTPTPTRTSFHSPTPTHNSNYTLLFVGRIYPVKGLVNLIKAWKFVQTQARNSQDLTTPFYRYNSSLQLNHPFSNSNSELELNHPLSNSNSELQLNPHWTLRIVGPDQAGHRAELESLVRELNLCDSVEFVGPKFGDALSAEYDNCDCLVLPSFTENFGATIVDAMAHGKPCIASKFTPWQELRERGCGWWVGNDPESLADALMDMMLLDDSERREMGENGRVLVEAKYAWNSVAVKMLKIYEDAIRSKQI